MRQGAPERTGWRDEQISLRHRQWGFNCPAVDLDFIMLEYNNAKVACLVEYKNEHAAPQYATHPSYRALAELADKANIPFIAVRYGSDFSWWRAHPINKNAKKYLTSPTELNEKGWVELLYKIRGKQMPEELFDQPI